MIFPMTLSINVERQVLRYARCEKDGTRGNSTPVTVLQRYRDHKRGNSSRYKDGKRS